MNLNKILLVAFTMIASSVYAQPIDLTIKNDVKSDRPSNTPLSTGGAVYNSSQSSSVKEYDAKQADLQEKIRAAKTNQRVKQAQEQQIQQVQIQQNSNISPSSSSNQGYFDRINSLIGK